MQAIILAAGMGKRLGDLTENNTKCMIKVHNQTLIERMLDQLTTIPVDRIVLVVGYKGDKVKELIGDKWNNIPVTYVNNPIYDKTNNIYSLYLAKDYLVQDDTLLLESDLILDKAILDRLLSNPYPNLAVVSKYKSWMDGTVVMLNNDDSILNFIPKKSFCYDDRELYFKTVNVYKFSKSFSESKYVPFLEAYCRALGNNEYYEQVLRVISLLDKPDLKAMRLSGEKWYEIDDKQDLANAETVFADEDQAMQSYSSRYGGYWRFDQLIDFCYLVNPFFPNQRMIAEMKAYFDTLLSQYPSGMGVNTNLAARYCNIKQEQIVVGNGAPELIQAYLRLNNAPTGIILPNFEEYPNRLDQTKVIAFTPEKEDFSYTVNDVMNFFNDKEIQQLVIVNPDNPSGNYIPKTGLLTLINWAKTKNIRLIIDESFVDFSNPEDDVTLLNKALLQANPHLIVVKSISKSYGVPGLRLGFLASGDTELISRLKKEVSIWNINSFAEFFMQIFTKYQDDYNTARCLFIEERKRFFSELQTVPYLEVIPSAANYFLVKVTRKYTTAFICNQLLSQDNILLKDCSTKAGFNGKQYLRIAIRCKEDNDKLLNALKKL